MRRCILFALVLLLFVSVKEGLTFDVGDKYQLSFWFQLRYNHYDNDQMVRNYGKDGFDSLLMNRVRLAVSGEPIEKLSFVLQLAMDGASQKTLTHIEPERESFAQKPLLYNASATYSFFPLLKVEMGLQKIPFSRESLQSGNALFTIDRSIPTEFLTPARKSHGANSREIGIWLRGEQTAKEIWKYGYTVCLVQGEGRMTSDTNDQKDIGARLEFGHDRYFDIALSSYHGHSGPESLRFDRYNFDCQVRLWKFSFQGEYFRGTDESLASPDIEPWGFYALLNANVWGSIHLVAKYECYDPDLPEQQIDQYTGGVRYVPKKYFKAEVNYVITDFESQAMEQEEKLYIQCQFKF